jgi:hypothetical protein
MKKPLLLALTLFMVFAVAAPIQAASSQEVSQGTYDVVVYIEDSMIIAEDSTGQVIGNGTAGTADSKVIQTAMQAIDNGTVVINVGTYALSSPVEVSVFNPTVKPKPTPTVTPTPNPSRKPDLVVTNISWEPANPVAGNAVTLKAVIQNKGDAPTPAGVKHGVLFTFDDGAAGSGVWSDTHTQAIAPGAWVTVTANGGLAGATWTAVQGTHTVKAHVDDVNRIAESDEANNVRTEQITIPKAASTPTPTPTPSGKPDLIVTDVSWTPANPATGDAITMKAVIKNQGTGATPAGTIHGVAFTSSESLGSAVWSDGYKDSLAPGESVTVTANGGSAGSTWTAAAGTYTVTATVDDVNRISESNEDNNVLTRTMTVSAAGPVPTPTVTPTPTPTPTQTPGQNAYGADANPTGSPIGGGSGYKNIVSRSSAKFIVDTKSELLSALQSARSGDVIYVEGNANIDMSGSYDVRIPAGVTLASNRGEGGAAGGRIYQSSRSASTTFRIGGEHVRISGLRIEGPDTTSSSPTVAGIISSYRNLEVDNCEIFGWGNAAIGLIGTGGADMKTGGYIHHNYIHHNQNAGLGYGVCVSSGAVALIEANYFDYCRHGIAGAGMAGDGYEARYNICGPNWFGISPHNFDMHGTSTGSGTIAGDTIKIHHNTFLGTTSQMPTCIAIRGMPRVGAYIDHNWFYFTRDAPVWQTGGRTGVSVTNNLIGQNGQLSVSGPIKYY